jgi:hypothetical protein
MKKQESTKQNVFVKEISFVKGSTNPDIKNDSAYIIGHCFNTLTSIGNNTFFEFSYYTEHSTGKVCKNFCT